MKIALLTESFVKHMGYAANMLPRYLAQQGAEVHLITTGLPYYYYIKDFKSTYPAFEESRRSRPGTVESIDGYTLHTVHYERVLGYIRMKGLARKLSSLKPDVTYSMAAIGWIPLEAALLKPLVRYRLFTGSHTTASVFPLAQGPVSWRDPRMMKNFLTRVVPGRFVSWFTTKCYGATKDCADIAVDFFGVQKSKIDFCPLGVDTHLFSPVSGERMEAQRKATRLDLGVQPGEILCIYTGRFAQDKNPRLLADAVGRLVAAGEPYRAVFIGNGTQVAELQRAPGCTVLPFMPVDDLPKYYQASDIAVWPTQESTSMLDAAACGVPVVVNDTLIATERIEGNGLTYRLNNADDLTRVLLLLKDVQLRHKLGRAGSEKMAREFSWESIARRRMRDFEAALRGRSGGAGGAAGVDVG